MRQLAGSLSPGEMAPQDRGTADGAWTAMAVRLVAALAMAGGALALFSQTIVLQEPKL